jgi:hypothetical protein
MSRPIVLVVALVLNGFGDLARAQPAPAESLQITGRADQISDVSGGEAGVQWLRTMSDVAGVHAGGVGGSIADSWWLAAKVGGHRKWRTITGSGALDFGRANDGARRFNYGGVKAGIAFPVTPSVVVEANAQHVALPRHTSQRVYHSSMSWHLRPSTSVQAGYYRLSAANQRAHLVSGRLDASAGGILWIVGGVLGPVRHADPLSVHLRLSPPSREFFGGCLFQVGRYGMSTVLNVTQSPIRAARMLVGVRIPLG